MMATLSLEVSLAPLSTLAVATLPSLQARQWDTAETDPESNVARPPSKFEITLRSVVSIVALAVLLRR